MNFKLIGLIIGNTIQKELRNRALFFLLVMTLGIMLLALGILSYVNKEFLVDQSMEALGNTTIGFFFVVINFWSYLISAYFGVGTVRSDYEGGVISQLLSLPMGRGEYIIGRILGAWILVMGYYLFSLLMGTLGVSFTLGQFSFSPQMLLGLMANSVSLICVIALSVFIGLYFSRIQAFLSVMLLTFFITASNTWMQEKDFWIEIKTFGVFKTIGLIFYSFFPHISRWGELANALILKSPVMIKIWPEVGHTLATLTLFLVLIIQVFKKRDI